jgi:hypothetical protein
MPGLSQVSLYRNLRPRLPTSVDCNQSTLWVQGTMAAVAKKQVLGLQFSPSPWSTLSPAVNVTNGNFLSALYVPQGHHVDMVVQVLLR